jgi:hypothetical protein
VNFVSLQALDMREERLTWRDFRKRAKIEAGK